MSSSVDTMPLSLEVPEPDVARDEPPFLQEASTPVQAGPRPALSEQLADMAYRRRTAGLILLATLVAAAMALAYRSPSGETASSEGGATASTPSPETAAAPATAAVTVAATAPPTTAGAGGSTITPPDARPTPVDANAPADTGALMTSVRSALQAVGSAPVVTTATTEPPTTQPPTTVQTPATVATYQPSFCMVWVDRNATLRAEPSENAESVGEISFGLYWVTSVSDTKPRYYQVENWQTKGWVEGREAKRQGDCSSPD